ncbi:MULTISPECIES: hypothetical protein [Bacillus cereus group]|uniref:hypothetical protein n=1 Tax=Bacillus cereus group TaxID=86661 RepID=UPI000BF417B9|nr:MULTISPECIES: hypothetical protein [Bacillus cereus group]PEQ52366.1 hypothetical protein CN473_15045 [Bacillus thuringiensis]PFO54911.1 hypothetical protein COJ71_01205 [Bacillus cereus]PGW21578.1 hypothetical protein COD95_17780 [Bacillus thuringiensis]
MKNRRNFYLLIVVTFVIMAACKTFGNLYVASMGVALGLSVGLAIVTARISDFLRRRKEDEDV